MALLQEYCCCHETNCLILRCLIEFVVLNGISTKTRMLFLAFWFLCFFWDFMLKASFVYFDIVEVFVVLLFLTIK